MSLRRVDLHGNSNESAETNRQYYEMGKQYWSTIDATVDGMLGGFAHISDIDIEDSNRLLNRYFKHRTAQDRPDCRTRALDCGAGIGRITKHLLLRYFDRVDLLEQNDAFLAKAREYIGEQVYDARVTAINDSLHTFDQPLTQVYDVVWCQWVTGHLSDDDFVLFLGRCRKLIKTHGIIVIKDNHTTTGEVERDLEDGAVTRPYHLLLQLFARANLTVLCEQRQTKFPKSLYPVKMFVLR